MSHSFRLGLEALEDRNCPSAMQASLQAHTLKITGNDEWNVVQLTQDDVNNTLKVVYGQLPHDSTMATLIVNTVTYKSSDITRITVDLGLGNDNFEYRLAGGTDLIYAKDLSVDTGAGDDSVTINTSAAAGTASSASLVTLPDITAVNGVLTADGNIITIPQLQDASASSEFASTIRNTFSVSVTTGTGNDSANVITGNLQGRIKSTISVDLGVDQDQFWLSQEGTVNKGATLTYNINGNDGKDALNVGSYGDVGGALNLNVSGGYGDDTILVDIQGLYQGKTTVKVSGGVGDDAMILHALLNPSSNGQVTLSASGDSGNDTALVDGAFILSGIETWGPLV